MSTPGHLIAICFPLGTLGENATDNDLIYVGHSMGTTMSFVLLSEKPEYNDKIRLFVALAPVAYMSHIKSPIRFLAPFSKEYEVKSHKFPFSGRVSHFQI
jgi:pimeloyl-ACP methyl ester carboxylesterase